MKTLLLACLLLAATSGRAQMKTFKDWTDSSRYFMYKAGKELVASNKSYKTGVLCSVSGLVLTGIGAALSTKNTTIKNAKSVGDQSAALYIAGGILEFIGIFHIVESSTHIKRAGIHLQGKAVAIDL
jgi:hypothetical protein